MFHPRTQYQMMMNKERDLEEELLQGIEKDIPGGRKKSSSLEEAFEKALGFEKETSDVITENEWI